MNYFSQLPSRPLFSHTSSNSNGYEAAFPASHTHLAVTRNELAEWEATTAQARQTRTLRHIQLAVLTAGICFSPECHRLQEELAALSSRRARRIIEKADHLNIVTNREHAQATINAIRELVNTI